MAHNFYIASMDGNSSESSFYSDSDSCDEVTSSLSAPAAPTVHPAVNGGGALDMSALMIQLPVWSGLSNFYKGKSQSFSCLTAAARRCSPLAKPVNISDRMLKLRILRRKHLRKANGRSPNSQSSKGSLSYLRVRRSSPSAAATNGSLLPAPAPTSSTASTMTNPTELFDCDI